MMRREAGGLLRSLIDVTPIPMWLIEPEGSVALVNEAAATVLGYSHERELIGRSSHEALHSRHADGSPYPSHQCPIVTACGSVEHSHAEEFIDRRGRSLAVRWKLRQIDDSEFKLLTFTPSPSRGRSQGSRGRSMTLPATPFEEFRAYIESHCEDPALTPDLLAERSGMSLRTLQAIFAGEGTSPAQEIRRARLQRGHRMLEEGNAVAEAAFSSGFNDVGTFSRAYRRAFNRPPVVTKSRHQSHGCEMLSGHFS